MRVGYGDSRVFCVLAAGLPLALLGIASARVDPRATSTPIMSVGVDMVHYLRDVKPVLARCNPCHGNGAQLGGFRIDSRAALLKGGQSGPAVVAGDSGHSLLIKLVSGQVPDKVMPARGPRLTTAEIAVLRRWIDQGLTFDGANGETAWQPPLLPRRPVVPPAPAGSGLTNPIDRLLLLYFRAHKMGPPPVVDDRTYARRVYLDLIGLLPTPAQLNSFLADSRPDRRARLAERLLDDNPHYAEHWLTFWNDMLRNDYVGTGYIDGGRTQITGWLYNALVGNMPYNRFVSQLVDPTPESAGFIRGIVWRGAVNASQTPEMQAAQNISQVFLGVNLKCASCHNSFISTWKLADAYGMASIYADHALEMIRCDKPTGQVASVKFMYPQLGAIDGNAPPAKRRQQLAALLTSRANGRFSRTLVNRLWARLMGRGLVEPTDEMDNRPWDPDLLDWLASDFADNGYDVKRTIERIVTSRAYQSPAMSLTSDRTERAESFVFRGPVVKRMSAEQFCDAVSSLTGVWPSPADPLRIVHGEPIVPTGHHASIRYQSGVMRSGVTDIDIDVTGAQTLMLVATDAGDGADYDWTDWANPQLVGPSGTMRLTDLPWHSATTGYGKIQIGKSVLEKPIRLGDKTFKDGIGTHANSIITYLLPAGVTRFRATAGPDTGGVQEGMSKTSIALYVITGDRSLAEARAGLTVADPLMQALGRPNRDQVVTERSTAATTLQALELTNGQTLATTLAQGAQRWLKDSRATPEKIVRSIYESALGRSPTPPERQIALEMVGFPAQKEGIEDLLWGLIMLPEFQLVY